MGQSLGWLKAGLPRSYSPAAVLRLLPARRPRWQRPFSERAVRFVSEVFFLSSLLPSLVAIAACIVSCPSHVLSQEHDVMDGGAEKRGGVREVQREGLLRYYLHP